MWHFALPSVRLKYLIVDVNLSSLAQWSKASLDTIEPNYSRRCSHLINTPFQEASINGLIDFLTEMSFQMGGHVLDPTIAGVPSRRVASKANQSSAQFLFMPRYQCDECILSCTSHTLHFVASHHRGEVLSRICEMEALVESPHSLLKSSGVPLATSSHDQLIVALCRSQAYQFTLATMMVSSCISSAKRREMGLSSTQILTFRVSPFQSHRSQHSQTSI